MVHERGLTSQFQSGRVGSGRVTVIGRPGVSHLQLPPPHMCTASQELPVRIASRLESASMAKRGVEHCIVS